MRGLTTAKSEAFQGRHSERLLLIYDEAVGIEPQLFEVGRSLFTGSPGQGWVCFYNQTNAGSQVYREESSGQWNTVTMSQFDHPNVAAEADLIDMSRLPDDERRRLEIELLTPTYDLDPMNRLRVEPKDITKKKLRRSPDLADAFNLACYWPYPTSG